MGRDAFPKTIHITADPNAGGPLEDRNVEDLLAFRTVEDSMQSDDPQDVAEYKLVRVRRFRRSVVDMGESRSS